MQRPGGRLCALLMHHAEVHAMGRHAASARSASATVMAMGFSTSTCLPAAAAASMSRACAAGGVQIETSSTSVVPQQRFDRGEHGHAKRAGGRVARGAIRVGERDEPDPRELAEAGRVPATDAAASDHSHADGSDSGHAGGTSSGRTRPASGVVARVPSMRTTVGARSRMFASAPRREPARIPGPRAMRKPRPR